MSMQLTPPTEGYYEHTSLDLLIKQINEHVKGIQLLKPVSGSSSSFTMHSKGHSFSFAIGEAMVMTLI